MTDTALSRGSGAARGRRFCLVLGLGIALFLLLHDRIAGINLAVVIPALSAVIGLPGPPDRQRAALLTLGPTLPASPPRAAAGLSRQGVLTPERSGSAPGWLLGRLPGSPDGTMHALLTAAIDAARDVGSPRLSLAAAPLSPRRHRAGRRPDSGLTRFKTAFAPHWEPLYLCAAPACALTVTAADIAPAVLRPAPLASAAPFDHVRSNEIAPAAATWQRKAMRPPAFLGALLRKEL